MLSSASHTVTDLDDFRAKLRPLNAEIIVTARGRFMATVTRVDFDRLWTQRTQESLPRVIHASTSPNRVGFAFLTHPGAGIVWNGREARSSDIISAPSGRDFCYRLSGSPNWGGMSLPEEYLAEIGAAVTGRDLVPPPDASPATPSPTAMARLLRLHSEAESLARNAPAILSHPESARGLEQALIQALIACIAVAPDLQKERPARHRHHAIMTRFRAVLEQCENQVVHIPELCMAVGVPARTLRACCQEYLGMSPKQFLTLRRLHLAHLVLHQSDYAKATVTEIATSFGFWELGRFAIEYRSVFGETPSATLRR